MAAGLEALFAGGVLLGVVVFFPVGIKLITDFDAFLRRNGDRHGRRPAVRVD